MKRFFQAGLGYAAILAPQIYAALTEYSLAHPNPYLTAGLSLVGGLILHVTQPPKK